MPAVLAIGFPVEQVSRLVAEARRNEKFVEVVRAKIGKEGTYRLVPNDEHAKYQLSGYLDGLDDFSEAHILVLPYAPIPDDLRLELLSFEELGAKVAFGEGANFPEFKVGGADQAFLDSVFRAVVRELLVNPAALPSEYFIAVSARCPRFLICNGSLDVCDDVAHTRFQFLRDAADAFEQLLIEEGVSGRIDSFFRERGLDHAQSGGISATLNVYRDGKRLLSNTTQTHLKQGDKTTAIAAARVYYQLVVVDSANHIALLYAGPHPDKDCTREVNL
jgi:hypothetical protein